MLIEFQHNQIFNLKEESADSSFYLVYLNF